MKIDIGDTKGVIRRLDSLGRIVIPKEFRESLELKEKDKLEIILLQDGLYIKRSEEKW